MALRRPIRSAAREAGRTTPVSIARYGPPAIDGRYCPTASGQVVPIEGRHFAQGTAPTAAPLIRRRR